MGELRALIILASPQPPISCVTSRYRSPHQLFLTPPGRWRLWLAFVEADSVPSGTEVGALGRYEPSPGGRVPCGKKRTASCSLLQREGARVALDGRPRPTRARGEGARPSRGRQEQARGHRCILGQQVAGEVRCGLTAPF